MPIIKVNGKNVHFQELNPDGTETVFMLHGMLGNLAIFYFQIAPLLAARFRVILYDLKGHGLSEKAPEGYDLTSMAEDLIALMDSFQLRMVHLTGYSYGALIALKAAILYPVRFKKLAIIEAPNPCDEEPLEMISAYKYNKEALSEYVSSRTNGSLQAKGKRRSAKDNRLHDFLFTETSIREDMHLERSFFYGGSINGILHKTLLIYGQGSDCLADGYALSYKMTNSRLVLLEGDHAVPVQQPIETALCLERFFCK